MCGDGWQYYCSRNWKGIILNRVKKITQPQICGVLIFLLCVSAWAGGYLYIVDAKITLLRFSVAVAFAFCMFMQYRQNPKIYYYTLLFFLVYSVYTLIITPLNDEFSTISGYIDFITIGLLVYTLLCLSFRDCRQSLKIFYVLCMLYVPMMSLVGMVEFLTGWHLPFSRASVMNVDDICGLSFNPNDYAVLVAMSLLYWFAYRKNFVVGRDIWVDVLYAVVAFVVFVVSQCRSAIVVEILFLGFMCRDKLKKYMRPLLVVGVIAIVAIVVLLRHDDTLSYRGWLWVASFNSLFDSYGFGFGIWGDRHYLSLQDNRDQLHGLTNAHSYLFQMLFTSGIVVFIAYVLLLFYLMRTMSKAGRNEFWVMPFFYLLLLFSPASSLFLWGQYLLFVFIVCYAGYVVQNENQIKCQ